MGKEFRQTHSTRITEKEVGGLRFVKRASFEIVDAAGVAGGGDRIIELDPPPHSSSSSSSSL